MSQSDKLVDDLYCLFVQIISETNGISLIDTLDLARRSELALNNYEVLKGLQDFREKLYLFQKREIKMKEVLEHKVSKAIYRYFRNFPLRYNEDHIHLTGSLNADFLFPRIQELLKGPHAEAYKARIEKVYNIEDLKVETPDDIDKLIRLKDNERFDRYLQILDLPKLVMTTQEAHRAAAYHMASDLYNNYNVGRLRLKFTLSRRSTSSEQKIPGVDDLTEEQVVTGLFEGFLEFKSERPDFDFILSPSFRKEPDFYDSQRFPNKQADFLHQVNQLLKILDRHPELQSYVNEVDTVGNERDLFAKRHFQEMKIGFRKLQYRGFKIRSHHGEVWTTLNRGIQAVDNAMNIWHIDTLEHGLSLGINPNFYFHDLYQKVNVLNSKGQPVPKGGILAEELAQLHWSSGSGILSKLMQGSPLTEDEKVLFLKAKFHTAREVEHYQHDVLNRLTDKNVSLVSLPSSNTKLTAFFPDYRDHPFSWWEKKGVALGVGTDNYITLNTDYIQEMLILLYTDPEDLKITKLLMVTTGEQRRPFLSHLMWKMRKNTQGAPGSGEDAR